MRTLLTFGEGATSSSESHVFSALGVRSPGNWISAFQKLDFGGRSESVLGHFRLGVSEDTSTHEAPALDATLLGMLPGMWWELLWRWWARLPASYTSKEKTLVRKTSLFRKSFPVWGCVGGPACGTCPECEIGRESDGHVIDPVRIYRIRYSSDWLGKSGFFPVLFRNSLALTLLLVPQPLADCAPRLPLPRPRTASQLEIRVGPNRAPSEEFRWAESTSGCLQVDYSSSVSTSQGWE